MAEAPRKFNFRIGLMEWPYFSREDSASFHVLIKDHGFMQIPVEYFETEDLAEAKLRLHAYVDKLFDHKDHMAMLERVGAESKQRHQELVRELRTVQTLTIGEAPPAPAPAAKKDSGLLDLCGEVLGDNGTGQSNS